MNVSEIATGVYYVGMNDRTTPLFERLWPIPHGVTYNSYLIKDDKNVLVDTVESADSSEYLAHIREISDNKPVDYLVVNHMEPDHSGSMPAIIKSYPDLKIIGNAITVQMIKGFYGIEDDSRFLTVKDGDELNIGKLTLKFITTPMVHWPETMMTYVKEHKLLFSCDAFGTFGALNGNILDEEIDVSLYLEEMYRYYSNIVGKYGKFVDNAFLKLASYEIGMICPSHGPVWKKHIREVCGRYADLCHYKGEDGIVIVYASMYGYTRKMANYLASAIASRGYSNIKLYDASSTPLSVLISECFRYNKLIFGSPTYQMELFPFIDNLLKALSVRETKNKRMAYFSSYAWAPRVALARFQEYAKEMDFENIGGVEMKQGMFDAIKPELDALADEILKPGKNS